MLILYDFSNSVSCQKVRITLCAKGLKWDAVNVDLFKGEQYDPTYLGLNPTGFVPTLVHDGKSVIESTLICEYIDQAFPNPPQLIPSEPLLQARMRLWSKLVDEGVHEAVTEISFSAMFRERMRKSPPESRELRFRNIGDPRRSDRFRSTYELGTKSPFVLHGIGAFERAFKTLDDELIESGGPWVLGTDPTLADVNLMPYFARLDYLRVLHLWIGKRPNVETWWAMAREWPSFKSAVDDRISEAERSEMSIHGDKIAGDIAEALAEVRRNMGAAMAKESRVLPDRT